MNKNIFYQSGDSFFFFTPNFPLKLFIVRLSCTEESSQRADRFMKDGYAKANFKEEREGKRKTNSCNEVPQNIPIRRNEKVNKM